MTSTPAPIRFGPFTLDVAAGQLLRDGRAVNLRPRPFDVLVALASRPGELVTKDELLDAVWGTRFVTEGVIKTAVAELRTALGEDSREPTWLHTVPRRGYRFESGATSPAAPAIDVGALVGRDASLRPLAAAWQEACAGRRGFVLVSGEPGVGKTALLEHFVSGLDDARVLAGACTEAWAGAEPYQPLLDALAHACKLDSTLVASLRATAPTWLLQLPWLTDEAVRLSLQQATAGASQERMIRELTTWLEQVAEQQPVLVLIEDLHWADPATVQWLGSLAGRRAPARLLVVGSVRPTELALSASPFGALRTELRLRQQIREVALAGLGPDDVAALVHRELGGKPVSHDQLLALHRFTDGLPLFVLGLVREWREQPHSMRLNVPADLGAVIDRQCDRLPPETRRLLETAALAAAEFDHLTLAHALDLPPDAVREQLEDLVRRQIWLRASGSIVLGDGRLALQCTFGHALIRHALASRLGLVQRAERHRRLAAALEALQPQRAESLAPELARHHREGQQPLQAARQLAVVARVALQRHAPREAQAAADAGLAQLSRMPTGAPADTVQDVRLALDSLRLTAALQLQGLASPESRALIAQVLSQVSTLPVGDATLPLWQVILLSHFAGRLPGTSSLVAVFGARAAHGSVAAQAIAASAQGVEHLHNGRIAQSLASFTQSLALCDRFEGNVALLRDPRFGAWAYLALVAPVAGDAELARRAWAAVDGVIEAGTDLISLGMGRWFECYAAYLRDDPDTVLALARPAVELLEARRSSPFLQPLRLVLGWACAARGGGTEGLALAANALEQYRLQGSRQGFAGLCAMACQTACIAGDVADTGRLLDQAFTAADEVGDQFAASELWRLRAGLARQQGDMDAFQAHLRRARDIAESSGSPLLLARVLRSEAGDHATRAA